MNCKDFVKMLEKIEVKDLKGLSLKMEFMPKTYVNFYVSDARYDNCDGTYNISIRCNIIRKFRGYEVNYGHICLFIEIDRKGIKVDILEYLAFMPIWGFIDKIVNNALLYLYNELKRIKEDKKLHGVRCEYGGHKRNNK